MDISIIPEVGDTFLAKSFAFKNKYGGTGLSNWDYDERYTRKPPKIVITKVWYDYEVGYRCWAAAVSKELIEYLERVAHDTDKRIFVSEHELLKKVKQEIPRVFSPCG